MNCLRPGHFSKQCKSINKCRKCQKPHHTLIHTDKKEGSDQSAPPTSIVSSNAASGIASDDVSSPYSPSKSFTVTAVVVPWVTCDLPVEPVHFESRWTHLSDLPLADPDLDVLGRSTSYWEWTFTLT